MKNIRQSKTRGIVYSYVVQALASTVEAVVKEKSKRSHGRIGHINEY